jgi:uncharacterized protein
MTRWSPFRFPAIDIRVDLVAVNESERRIRFGSCKRSPARLLSDVNHFKQHVERFLRALPKYETWTRDYVGIATRLDAEHRVVLAADGIIPQDLADLTVGLDYE